jgi:hypothetical protein
MAKPRRWSSRALRDVEVVAEITCAKGAENDLRQAGSSDEGGIGVGA